MRNALILTVVALTGCATQQYWNRDGTNLRQTAADIHDCRMSANQGGQKVFGPVDMEHPCMVARGYRLSNTPPPTE